MKTRSSSKSDKNKQFVVFNQEETTNEEDEEQFEDKDATKGGKNIKFKGGFKAFITLTDNIRKLSEKEALNEQQIKLLKKSKFWK